MEAEAPDHTWPTLLTALVEGRDLSRAEADWAMDRVMAGEADPVQLAGLLVGLRAKGETVGELTGLADAMLRAAVPIDVPGPSVDIVGTGGDRARTVNISTTAALVVAGTGLRVVKHGNRAASSSSGSADVLEALGLDLDQPVERVAALASEVGITFCFAVVFHPSMRHAAAARSGLRIPTVFNFLGPLTNPARPRAAAIGVADLRMAPLMAGVLAERGDRALVFRNEDGLDELAPTASSRIWEVRDGEVGERVVDTAAELGLTPITIDALRGGDPQENAQVVRDVLAGQAGAVREAVVLNAAAALVADASLPGTASGSLVDRLASGMAHAERSIDDGAAAGVLERWVAASRSQG